MEKKINKHRKKLVQSRQITIAAKIQLNNITANNNNKQYKRNITKYTYILERKLKVTTKQLKRYTLSNRCLTPEF